MTEQHEFKCPSCSSKMIRLDWNTMVDMMVCDNYKCPRYRQPGPSVEKGTMLATKPAPTTGKKASSLFGRGTGRPRKAILPEEFLDDQEISPTVENLRRLRERFLAKKEDPEVL